MVGPEFASCWLKMGRAEAHLDAIKGKIKKWVGTDPYKSRHQRNADGSRHSVILDVIGIPPFDDLALLAGDCAHNLRSALDHLFYALAVQKSGRNPPPNVRNLEFPICETQEGFNKRRAVMSSSIAAKASTGHLTTLSDKMFQG